MADPTFKLKKRFNTAYQNFLQENEGVEISEETLEHAIHEQSVNRSKAWKSLESILWLVSSLIILRYTDFLLVIIYDPAVLRPWFYAGFGFLLIFLVIGCWLIFYYKTILRIDDYEKHVPAAIPIATTSFLISFACFTYSLWPIWRFLTPILLFILLMGVVVVVSLF